MIENENGKKTFVDFNNNLTLTGFICKDITLGSTANGKTVTNIMLNVKQGKDKDDKDVYEPVFIKAFGDKATTVAETYKKKDLVTVCGKLSTHFEDGRYSIDVILTDMQKFKAKDKSETTATAAPQASGTAAAKKNVTKGEIER